jgi:F-type H+-transporting ATPase subunit delta
VESTQVARRYARGLFGVTQDENSSDPVNADFQEVAKICTEDKSLLQFLAAPQIGDDDKAGVVEKIFAGQVQRRLYNLLQLLVAKHRTSFLVEIASEYEKLVLENVGVVKTTLITAIPLRGNEEEKINAKLSALTGKTIRIEAKVDPAIIGGVVAIVGDKIIDRSIRHDLHLLRDKLLELKVA